MTAFVDVIRPETKSRRRVFDALCIVGGSLFLALMAQCAIPLGFTPIPITLQTFGVMLLGALLGSKKGSLAVVLYLIEGMLGLPIFALGMAGPTVLFGPTGGYLFAFVPSAFLAGILLERGWKKSYMGTLVALTLSTLLTLGIGALWLSVFVGGKAAVTLGVYPFLIGGAIKVLVAAAMIPSGWKLLQAFR